MKLKYQVKRRWGWIKKTLFGYKLTIVSPTTIHHIEHRPFREPTITSERTTHHSLRGRSASVMILDEYQDRPVFTEEQLARLKAPLSGADFFRQEYTTDWETPKAKNETDSKRP